MLRLDLPYDASLGSEVTLILNDDHEVIGIETYFAEPQELNTFFNVRNVALSAYNVKGVKI